jgi:bacillithiol system protein YtxJ
MLSGLIVLDSVDALDRVIVASEERLVLLLKHSVTCGTSAQAHDELVAHLSEDQHATQHAIVTVQTHRDVSDAVATRLNVRHETPQVLLIQEGRVVWEASHFRVTVDAIKDAIERHSPS